MVYKIRNKSIWRVSDKDEIEIGNALAIAWSYDPDPNCLPDMRAHIHKVGPPILIEQWLDGVVNRIGPDIFTIYGFLGILLFDLDNIPLEEVNKMVSITGYIRKHLEREGIIEKAILLKAESEGKLNG